MDKKIITILVIVIGAVLIMNQIPEKEAGEIVNFRTTSLTYTDGSEIAYSSTCGNSLTAYGYTSKKLWNSGTCSAVVGTYIMDVPGTVLDSPAKLYKSGDTTLTICAQKILNNIDVYAYVRYADYMPTTISTSSNVIDLNMESTCSEEVPSICTDSDGGHVPDVFGTVTANGIDYNDYCTGTTLTEYYCNAQNMAIHMTYSCSACSGGVCTINCEPYGDSDCSGIIDREELGAVAQEWMSNPTSDLRNKLGIAAQNWIDNGGPA